MANLDLKQLRYFSAVVKHGSFRKAADELHISQPALSLAVKELERRLDVTLIERGAGQFCTTAYGASLYEHSLTIQASVQQAVASLDQLRGLQSGQVKVGVSPYVATGEMGLLLGRFSEDYPNIQVHTDNSLYDWSMARMLKGELDFFFCEIPSGLVDEVHTNNVLFHMPYGLICSTDHPLAGKSVTLARVLQYRLAYGKVWASQLHGWQESLQREQLSWPASYLDIGASEFYVNAVNCSELVALTAMTGYIKDLIANKKLATIRVKHSNWYTTAALVKRKGQALSPAAQKLFDIVRQELPAMSELRLVNN